MYPILTNQSNFRDIGGIQTSDGRKIKPGILFRSGDLHSLSDEDIQILENLNIRMIVDLRARREIDRHPDRVIKSVKSVVHIDIFDGARDRSERFLMENNAKGLETVLEVDYRRMVVHHAPDFQKFLHLLATTGHLPLIYHCAAGKDRTGLATIFLLAALGVEMADIRDDYMKTNRLTSSFNDKIIQKVTESGQNGIILRPLLEVRKEYLDAALDEIDIQYGGIHLYVKNILQADISLLRQKFLVP